MGRPKLLFWLLAGLLHPTNQAVSALLIVPDDYPTIQSAIDGAAPGDSVMARPGTYAEALALAGKDLTLFGESGAEVTVIAGGQAFRLFDIGAGVTPSTILSDLTFRDGFVVDRGAGIHLAAGASPTIRRCRFISNIAYCEACHTYGGALAAGSGSSSVIEDCLFMGNVADMGVYCCEWYGHGGAIYAGAGANLTIRRSTFHYNSAVGFEGGDGGAMYVDESASATVEDCQFDHHFAYGGGIYSVGSIEIRRSTFTANSGLAGTGVICVGGPFLIAESLFLDNECSFGDAGGAILVHGNGEVRNNTIAFNGGDCKYVGLLASRMAGLVIRNNIVALNTGTGVAIDTPAPGTFACNDVWGNAVNYCQQCPDQTGIEGNISLDPLLCDASARDLHLHIDSPCAPGAGACGLIGALGIGCGVSAIAEPEPAPQAELLAVRPNPFARTVEIAFTLRAATEVQLRIHDAAGRAMVSLADGTFGPGSHEIVWDGQIFPGRRAGSGVYFVELKTAGTRRIERLVLLR